MDPDTDASRLVAMCRSLDDWSKFSGRAAFHGVVGWVHETLLMLADDDCVPDGVMADLRRARINNTARIARMSVELKTLSRSLGDEGIDHILLKGPYLSEVIYERADLRYYTDLDLMVREREVGASGRVLEELGYDLIESDDSIFDQGKTQTHFFKPGCLPIDLHWETVNLPTHEGAFRIDIDDIWATAEMASIDGIEILSLSPEELLIFQCMHMTAHHDFNRLLWFKDVEQVIRRFDGRIDWSLFVKKVIQYRICTFVYYSLRMTGEVCGGATAPEWVFQSLRPKYGTARLFEHFARKSNILNLQEQKRKPALEVWRVMRDDGGKRCGAIAKRIFPGVEWYLECYPFLPKTSNHKLYYGVYPALMVMRLFKKPMR
jgi:hypothetical protein